MIYKAKPRIRLHASGKFTRVYRLFDRFRPDVAYHVGPFDTAEEAIKYGELVS